MFNPVYAGLTVRGKQKPGSVKREYRYISREDWICVKGGHEAIVTEQELQEIQDMVQKDRKYHGSTPSSENILQVDPLRALWSENADTDRIQRKADLL